MKLKEALVIAKYLGYNFIAVDGDEGIYAYTVKPQAKPPMWYSCDTSIRKYQKIGTYSGKKSWENTLRKVK